MKKNPKKQKNTFKQSFHMWFRGTSKYSYKELVLNWIIVLNLALIFLIEIIVMGVRWKYLVGAMTGTYPAFLWCPIWAGILFGVLIVIEMIAFLIKWTERRHRKKWKNKSSISPTLKKSPIGKFIDKKYESADDQKNKHKTFY